MTSASILTKKMLDYLPPSSKLIGLSNKGIIILPGKIFVDFPNATVSIKQLLSIAITT